MTMTIITKGKRKEKEKKRGRVHKSGLIEQEPARRKIEWIEKSKKCATKCKQYKQYKQYK